MRIFTIVVFFATACTPRVEFVPDGSPAYGHPIKPAEDVVVLERPPAEPHHLVGHLAWRQWVWEDKTTLRSLREVAGKAGCNAIIVPANRGAWADCVVLVRAGEVRGLRLPTRSPLSNGRE